MNNVTWKDPPPRTGGKGIAGIWLKALAPLLEEPGRWALVKSFESQQAAGSCAQSLAKRRVQIPHPDHEWEFVSRKSDNGSDGADVYARYLGASA
jgi:hypothetical protein